MSLREYLKAAVNGANAPEVDPHTGERLPPKSAGRIDQPGQDELEYHWLDDPAVTEPRDRAREEARAARVKRERARAPLFSDQAEEV